MTWQDLEKPWREAFEQGWKSFICGSIPIGAVIADEKGEIIVTGRNRLYEACQLNPKIAHAEMDCLLNLDVSKYPEIRAYTLYTCMEPCPMCMGAIVMGNIRHVRISARDRFAGATYFYRDNAYIASKNIRVRFELGMLEVVQLTMQTYFELRRCGGQLNKIVRLFEQDCPAAVRIAQDFYETRLLDNRAREGAAMCEVFDEIVSRL